MEHLATLERLRQSQRQDYLKVLFQTKFFKHNFEYLISFFFYFSGICFWVSSSHGSPYERIT